MTIEEIHSLINQLSSEDKVRLIGIIANDLIKSPATPLRPRRSLYGAWAQYGVSVSEEDIAEVRREMWGQYEGDS